jgi:hypothetical protein
VSTLFYGFKKPEIGQSQKKPSTICLIVSDLISRSQVSLKKEDQRAVLPLALPSNSPSLYTIIHFLIRPIQPVQRIMEVFIRPGTHHQNPPDLITPGWGSMPGLRKKGMEVWIILLRWSTQGHNQENGKHKKEDQKHDQKYNTQGVCEVHHLSLPIRGYPTMTSTTLARSAWSSLCCFATSQYTPGQVDQLYLYQRKHRGNIQNALASSSLMLNMERFSGSFCHRSLSKQPQRLCKG